MLTTRIFLKHLPEYKLALTSEVWESLPNQSTGNYVTNGNDALVYHKAIVSISSGP